jgi:hypothetical protein
MPEATDLHATFVVLTGVEPACPGSRMVAVDTEDEVSNVMPVPGHVRDRGLDRFTADDLAVADVQNAVRGERRYVEIVILEVERKQITRLEVLDQSPILGIARLLELNAPNSLWR